MKLKVDLLCELWSQINVASRRALRAPNVLLADRSGTCGTNLVLLLLLSACATGLERAAPLETDRPTPSAASAEASSLQSSEPTRLFESAVDKDQQDKLEPFVQIGSGRQLGRPRSSAPQLQQNDAGDITLNVVNADIREVVRLILEDGLNANYAIDPAISGTVTVRTSERVPADEVLPLLDSLLNLNGAALIEDGGLFRIVPLEQASISGAKPRVRPVSVAGQRGYGIQVVPLRYASAAELIELLQPFTSADVSIQLDPSLNTLLLVGSGSQLETLTDLIDIFDVDWMVGMSFGLYPLEEVSASVLLRELEQIFFSSAGGVSPDVLRFVPIDRLSAILVITAQPDFLRRTEDWIERLDKPGEGSGEQVYVYQVQNGRAADLAGVLAEIFDIRSTTVDTLPSTSLAPGLEPIALTSEDRDRPNLSNAEDGDGDGDGAGPLSSPGGIDPFAPFASATISDDAAASGAKIVADQANNALIIRATATDYREIEEALGKLDVEPLQVLLEATIAEVTLGDELSYGLQWFFRFGSSDVTLSEVATGGASGALGRFFPGFSGLFASSDVEVVLNALESVSDLNVISSPQVLVLDNQTARLQVGDEVPIVVRQTEGLDDIDARIVNTVEQRQTGVILDVTPRVNANGLVVLDIQQEVSDVVPTTTSGIDSPTVSQRLISTSVAVGTNQTVALGGLIQDSVEEIQSGLPYLSRLPVLGALFGATTQIKSRTELLVLITPRVISNQQEARAVTEELRQRVGAVAPLESKLGRGLANPPPTAPPSPKPDKAARREAVSDETDKLKLLTKTASSYPKTAGASPHYRVQLYAARGPHSIDQAWDRLKGDFRSVLEGYDPHIEEIKQNEENLYQLQVGNFKQFAEAAMLCNEFKEADTDCWVVKRN